MERARRRREVWVLTFLCSVLCMTVSSSGQQKKGERIPPEETMMPKAQTQQEETQKGLRIDWIMSVFQRKTSRQSVKFHIYRSDVRIGPYVLIDSVDFGADETSFTYRDTTARYAMVYWYRVGAVDEAGFEYLSDADSATPYDLPLPPATPGPVTNLNALDTPDDEGGSITLTWTKSPDDSIVINYYIFCSRMSGDEYACIDSVGAGIETYEDTVTADGHTRYYIVRAHNGINGSNSNEASGVSINNLAPQPPTGLTACSEPLGIGLAWQGNTEPDLWGYRLYRTTVSGTSYVLLTDPILLDTTYFDTDVLPNTVYYYVVTALDRAYPLNESRYSNEVRGELRP